MAFEHVMLLLPESMPAATGLDLNAAAVKCVIIPPCKCTLISAQLVELDSDAGDVLLSFESPEGTNIAVMNLSNTTVNTVVSVAPSSQVVLSPNVPVVLNVRSENVNSSTWAVPRLLVSYSPETLENLKGSVALREAE